MIRISSSIALVSLLFLNACAEADETKDDAAPTPGHAWLEKLVGEWSMESVGSMGPDQPPMTCTGTMTVRNIGKFWIVCEVEGQVEEHRVEAVQTLGYDSDKKKYIGTWIDSMMNHMWQYDGHVEESERKLVLNAEGPNMMDDGKLTQYRDTYQFKSDDHIVVTSSMMTDEGEWVEFMEGNYRRK